MEKVDEAIDAICDWIQKEVKSPNAIQSNSIIPELTKALAELVSARENGTNSPVS